MLINVLGKIMIDSRVASRSQNKLAEFSRCSTDYHFPLVGRNSGVQYMHALALLRWHF